MADNMPDEKKALLDGNEEFEEELVVPGVSEEPETDTGTETGEPAKVEPDTVTETVSDSDPLKALMDELNLGGQYKSSEAVLRAVEAQRQHIENQRQENYDLRQVLQQVSKQPPTTSQPTSEEIAERLQQDPLGTIRDAGFVQQGDLKKTDERLNRLERVSEKSTVVNSMVGLDGLKDVSEYYNAHGEYPSNGYNPIWDAMMREYRDYPGIQYMPASEGIKILHELVKSKHLSKPPVKPVSDERKSGATTSSRGHRPVGEGGTPDFNKMTSTEIRNWFAERNRID